MSYCCSNILIKAQFPRLVSSECYLDSAATTHKPQCVIDAMAQFMAQEYATVHRVVYQSGMKSTQKYSEVREKVRQWLGAQSCEEIVFTKGTTDGLNLLAHSLSELVLEEGDTILITELEHHSNIVPWQLAAKRHGAFLKAVPILKSGELDMEVFQKLLQTEKVKIFSAAHVSNLLGLKRDIKTLVNMAKEYGSLTIVDGAQAPGHIPVDVQEIGAHFYLFSSHKIYGPTGVGVLYGQKEWLNKMPPYQGGGDMVDVVTLEATTYQKSPLKFEAGTPPIVEVIGLGAAIDFLQSIGLDAIMQHETTLFHDLYTKLKNVEGVKIVGDPHERIAILPFIVEGVHPLDLGSFLGTQGISIRTGHMCAQPALKALGLHHVCRVSLGIYTTQEDVDCFIEGLKETISLLKE